MKLRITPLNILCALLLGYAVFFFTGSFKGVFTEKVWNGFFYLIFGCLLVVAFISDLIFRFTLKDLKRIWITELLFIVLVIVLMLILQK